MAEIPVGCQRGSSERAAFRWNSACGAHATAPVSWCTLWRMAHSASNSDLTEQHLLEIDEQGYTILEDAIPNDLLGETAEALERLERDFEISPANNDFEGTHTIRIYNLLARGKVFERIAVHPQVLPIVKGVLGSGFLVSTTSSIAIGPDETPQLVHCDDQVIALPRPHPAIVCNSMWAVTDFTEDNGATRLVPGSHNFDHCPDPTATHETISAEMPRGSILVWHGSLWHGGGANRTRSRRTGVAMNYCAGFIRQQENQQLGIPREIAAGFSPELKRMCGYGVFRGLIGHVDKRDPIELLGDGGDLRVIWDN
jgi:ectoine hydroxylase-related dioxygenase (phytanoyl-CoA dioxygenase family)